MAFSSASSAVPEYNQEINKFGCAISSRRTSRGKEFNAIVKSKNIGWLGS